MIESHKLTNILLACVFVALAYLTFAQRDIRVHMAQDEQDRTITVEGTAETFVAPDTASVSFSVTKKAQSTDVAMDSINERMGVLVEELQRLDIAQKDIKTINYTVQPEYSYNNGTQKFEGYRATQRITVTIRDLSKASDVLGIVNRADVDHVSQLSFFVDETDEVMKELRKQAIDDAKEKAKILAKDLDVHLDDIVGYSDDNMDTGNQMLYRSQKMDYVMSAHEEDVADAVVPTGENQFRISVSVTYKID